MKHWFDIALLGYATYTLIVIGIASFRANRAQNRLVKLAEQTFPQHSWFRINVSRPGHFKRWWKSVYYETRGIIVVAEDHIRVLAEFPSGEAIDRSLPRDEVKFEWVAATPGQNGNCAWLRLTHAGEVLYISRNISFGWNTSMARDSSLATADLCRLLAPDVTQTPSASIGYALEKNPASLGVAIAFFVLLAYGLLDGFFINSYRLVNVDRIYYLGLFVLPVAIPCYYWLTRRDVPGPESSILAMLLAGVLAGASYPSVKRVDQLFADPPRTYDYRLLADQTLEPINPELPGLDYAFRKKYWQQFDTGSIHKFPLIHGPLGLWQVDLTDMQESMRKFYGGRPPRDE
jgi:hypothetical protein